MKSKLWIGLKPFGFRCVLIAFFVMLLYPSYSYADNKKVLQQQERLTMASKTLTIGELFSFVEKNTKYIFIYDVDKTELNKKISVSFKNETVKNVLDKSLKSTGLTYQIAGRQIMIKKAKINKNTKKVLVEGIIKDVEGEPLIGATIREVGVANNGTITEINGTFKLNVTQGNSIECTFLGFKPTVIRISKDSFHDIILEEETSALSEVVVIGYGQQKKESLVSSIGSIPSTELKVPTRNLTNALSGQVAGLISVQRSGEPGYDSSEFWIRGVSSFKGGTSPLILVDGVPRSMSDIDVDEIDSFTLLKDAAATAVYGAEGANGVIIITSKRGQAAKPRISFRAEVTNAQPTRLPKFLGSYDFLSLYNEALNNEGNEAVYADDVLDKYRSGEDRDLYPDTNWLDLMKKSTWSQRYTLNIRGGSDKARYFVSGAYFTENGLFKSNPVEKYDTNIGVDRYNMRSNIDLDVTKTTLVRVDVGGQYLLTNYPGVGTSQIFKSMLITPPFLMPMKYSDGTLAGHPRAGTNRENPYNQLMESGYAKEWRVALQSKVEVQQKLDFITKGLSARGAVSFDANMMHNTRRTKTPTQYQATGRDENGKLQFKEVLRGTDELKEAIGSSSSKNIYMEATVDYKRRFDLHDVTAMLLYMQKEQQYHNNSLPYRKQGFVGRMTYGYDDRYFVEANFGYTGSETFAKGHRFGFFPAIGTAWYLSNEHFYPEALKDIVSKVKLRASFGRTGNDNTGGSRFMYRGTLNQGAPGYNLGILDGGSSNGIGNGIIEGQFEAPSLTWEIETKQNYGIDLGFFDNAIDLLVDVFYNRRKDILLQRRTASNVTGFHQMPWQNFGEVKNSGFDASLVLNHTIGEVHLSARGNFTFARNKIVEYDEIPQKHPWMELTGKRLNSNNLYIADGLYTHDDFIITGDGLNKHYELKEGVIKSSLSNDIRPGDIKYKDMNGDGIIDSYDQVRDVSHPYVPEIVYGFGFNAEWKGFHAGIFFQGVGNTSTVLGENTKEGFFPFQWGYDQSSIRKEALNRWTEDNPSQKVLFPRLRSNNHPHNTASSTWWLRDASFLRLKNIEIGYVFPKKMLSKMHIESLRIYLMGNNLYVWDKIKMWDPEIGNANAGLNYPLPRTFTLGLDFTF